MLLSETPEHKSCARLSASHRQDAEKFPIALDQYVPMKLDPFKDSKLNDEQRKHLVGFKMCPQGRRRKLELILDYRKPTSRCSEIPLSFLRPLGESTDVPVGLQEMERCTNQIVIKSAPQEASAVIQGMPSSTFAKHTYTKQVA